MGQEHINAIRAINSAPNREMIFEIRVGARGILNGFSLLLNHF